MLGLFRPKPPLTSPDAVREAIRDRLVRDGRISDVTPKGEDGLEVTASGRTHAFFLENAVVAVLQPGASARGQHKTVKHYVSAFLSSLDAPPIDLDQVLPVVRHKDYAKKDGTEAIHTPMIGDLVCIAAENRPETLTFLSKDMLDDAQLGVAEVWGAARINLSVALKSVEDQDLGAGLHIMRLGEPWLGASVLLAPELLQVARRELGAEMLYVAAPAREGLVYIDSAVPGALVHMQEAVKIGLAQDHPQSDCIFTLRDEDETPVPGWTFKNEAFHALT